ncbi:MAG: alkyl hydroperoxide reductase [Acidobacteria bacterium]|nr:MAG: alkyl hydroperoxide reductase [Acidobacteriota bacterium]
MKAKWVTLAFLCVAGSQYITRAADLSRGDDRLGLVAPPLQLQHWVYSPALEISTLRGKVVLIRWWTEGCPFCVATAPALREFDRKYASRGLRVIGIFHPKPPGDWSVDRMRAAGARLGLRFPLALDAEWSALNRWWPELEKRCWTSVSFLVDKRGIIRYVHPGGEYHEALQDSDHARCDRDYKQIDHLVERLLHEN